MRLKEQNGDQRLVERKSERSAVNLDERVREDFFRIVEPSLHVNTQQDFFRWTQTELQGLFPHGKLVCGVGQLGVHGVHARHILGCNFSDEYLHTVQRADGLIRSPVILQWMKEQQPILFEPDRDGRRAISSAWLENFHRHGLLNMAVHGVCDHDKHTASFFGFACIPAPLTQRHGYLLKLLVPHLHVALMRVVANPRAVEAGVPAPQARLTLREMEILQWISSGKSNWEIAQMFGLSESTIKNHVHHILGKLQTSTRAQAVAKAISLELISAKH